MAIEPQRGCGFRKAGGIYLVSGGMGDPCERLPILLECCSSCGSGIKQTRSIRWMKPEVLLNSARACAFNPRHCPHCVVCQPVNLERHAIPKDRIALLWIGQQHYPKPQDWTIEAMKMGVSRRIAAIPKELVVGKSWVFVAHPEAVPVPIKVKKPGDLVEHDEIVMKPGIFHAFVPQAIEVVVTPSMKKEKWVQDMVEKNNVRLVEVPEDDPDHAPKIGKKSARKRSMERAARNVTKPKVEETQS